MKTLAGRPAVLRLCRLWVVVELFVFTVFGELTAAAARFIAALPLVARSGFTHNYGVGLKLCPHLTLGTSP